jgi:hypothetical protein
LFICSNKNCNIVLYSAQTQNPSKIGAAKPSKIGGVEGAQVSRRTTTPEEPNRRGDQVPELEPKDVVTPSFKVKTECISLCVLESSFTHKTTNNEINSITSVYYIKSYYKTITRPRGLNSENKHHATDK